VITSLSNANASGAAAIIDDEFGPSLSGLWTQTVGTWSTDTGVGLDYFLEVDALASGQAIILADADLDIVNYEVEVTFPTGSSTNKAGLVFAHDGDDSFYAVVLDRDAGKIALHKITGNSWGSALASASTTINDSTAYTVKVARTQGQVEASVSSVSFTYGANTGFGTGYSGLYSDKTEVTFDDFKAHDATARNALVPRFGGLADASISSGELLVTGSTRGGHPCPSLLQVAVAQVQAAQLADPQPAAVQRVDDRPVAQGVGTMGRCNEPLQFPRLKGRQVLPPDPDGIDQGQFLPVQPPLVHQEPVEAADAHALAPDAAGLEPKLEQVPDVVLDRLGGERPIPIEGQERGHVAHVGGQGLFRQPEFDADVEPEPRQWIVHVSISPEWFYGPLPVLVTTSQGGQK